jgi:hypothetical protein
MLRSRSVKLEPEDLRRNRIELAAAAVVDWHGWETNGLTFLCTPENVRLLFRQAEHILEQVEAAINSHSDFFTDSSPS